MENLVAIVPAAGSGKRLGLGINKAFVKLNGAPLLVHCLTMLEQTQMVRQAIVVLAPEEAEDGGSLLVSYQEKYFPNLPFKIALGGSERQDSVANALIAVPKDAEYIAVHDGARPFAGRDVFARTLAMAKKYGAAIAAVPVKNTIKVIDDNGLVVSTPVRAMLKAVQTPQIFRAQLLRQAYAFLQAHPTAVTDDASVVELLGNKVAVAEGRYENIKVTTPEDLILAEYFLKQEELKHGK